MSRRDRKKRGKGSLGRDWAPLPEPVMRTEAVRTLPYSAFKVWTVAVVLCKPWLNGAVPLTRSVLVQFGLTNSQATTAAIKLLLVRRLLMQTRKAISRHYALFGVTHLPFNEYPMKKAGAHEKHAPTDHQSTKPTNSRTTRESANANCPPVHSH